MKQTRMVGNYIEKLAKEKDVSVNDLSLFLGCDEHDILSLFKGRKLLTFNQFKDLSRLFGVSEEEILNGDVEHYNKTFVNCVNEFDDMNNREKILDILYDYIDLVDSVEKEL